MIVSINPVKKTLPLLCVTCAISFLFFPVDQKNAKMKKMKMINKVSPMKQELKKFIATGGAIEDAKRIMEANGFTCVLNQRSDFVEMEESGDFLATHHDLDYLYCDKERGGLFCARRWQVAIVHKNGVVSDILVSIGLTCL